MKEAVEQVAANTYAFQEGIEIVKIAGDSIEKLNDVCQPVERSGYSNSAFADQLANERSN